MSDTNLILAALKKPISSAPVKPKKIMKELEETLDCGETDKKDIFKSLKRKTKKPTEKTINKWLPIDFLKHLDSLLKPYNLRLERMTSRDSIVVTQIYDLILLEVTDKKMNNTILRDYFEWWASTQSNFYHNKKLYVHELKNDLKIKRFVTRYKQDEVVEEQKISIIDIDKLYNLGGIPMLLTSYGIVKTYNFLKVKDSNAVMSVSDSLRKLSKTNATESFEKTLSLAPYTQAELVDFVSLAKSATDYHSIKTFQSVSYQSFFKEN